MTYRACKLHIENPPSRQIQNFMFFILKILCVFNFRKCFPTQNNVKRSKLLFEHWAILVFMDQFIFPHSKFYKRYIGHVSADEGASQTPKIQTPVY